VNQSKAKVLLHLEVHFISACLLDTPLTRMIIYCSHKLTVATLKIAQPAVKNQSFFLAMS